MVDYKDLIPSHKEVVDIMAILNVDDAREEFDKISKEVVDKTWSDSEDLYDVIVNRFGGNILNNGINLPYNYYKSVIEIYEVINQIKDGEKDYVTYSEVKCIMNIVTSSIIKNIDNARDISDVIDFFKPITEDIMEMENKVAIAAEMLSSKETEVTQGIYSTLVKQHAEANNIELPKVPEYYEKESETLSDSE